MDLHFVVQSVDQPYPGQDTVRVSLMVVSEPVGPIGNPNNGYAMPVPGPHGTVNSLTVIVTPEEAQSAGFFPGVEFDVKLAKKTKK